MAVRNKPKAVTISAPERLILLLPGVLLGCGVGAFVVLSSSLLKRSSTLVTAAVVTALATALVIACARALRAGLRMEARGVTVRNFWSSHKISWLEVSHLGDGSVFWGDPGRLWTPGVVLRNGRTRNASTVLSLGESDLDAVREAAARYGVRAEVAGRAGTG